MELNWSQIVLRAKGSLVFEVGDSDYRKRSWNFGKERIQEKQGDRDHRRDEADKERDESDSRKTIRK